MTRNKQHSLLNRADEACQVLNENLEKENVVRIISHHDADGLSAAGIIANAISEENGQYHITIVPRLQENFIQKLIKEKYKLFFFCDMGSAYLDSISKIKGDVIISDHHQPMKYDTDSNITHVNPHLFGVDGSKEVSASGVTYLTVRGLKKQSLAWMALAGAFGDMQYNSEFISINKLIEDEGVKDGNIEIHQGLKIASKAEEPLYKSLAYTFNPIIPELTGNLEASQAFLERIGVSYGIKFSDLGEEERDILKDALIELNPEIFSNIYSSPKQVSSLRNIEEYSRILDACGKNKKFGLALGLCLGEKNEALDNALDIQRKYTLNLVEGLEWIRKEGSITMENLQYIYTDKKPRKNVLGTIGSIALSMETINPKLPLLSFSRMDNMVKISGRTTQDMVKCGVNLGQALDDASSNFNGTGGGHDIAAGAMIEYKYMDNFLNIMNDIIRHQING